MEQKFTPPAEPVFNEEPKVTHSDFGNIKVLGGLAALFIMGTFVPYIGALLGLASVIMFLISFYKISRLSGKKFIFNFILTAYILNLAVILSLIFFFFYAIYDILQNSGFSIDYIVNNFSIEGSFLNTVLVLIAFYYVVSIIIAFLWKRSLDACAVFLKEKLFATAGLLYVIGALSLILCGIGILITLAAHIVLAIAFFSVKTPVRSQK